MILSSSQLHSNSMNWFLNKFYPHLAAGKMHGTIGGLYVIHEKHNTCSLSDKRRAFFFHSNFSSLANEVRFWKWTVIAFCINIDRISSTFQIKWKFFIRFRWSYIEHCPNDCFHWSNFLFKIAFNLCSNRFENDTLMKIMSWKKVPCMYVICTLY